MKRSILSIILLIASHVLIVSCNQESSNIVEEADLSSLELDDFSPEELQFQLSVNSCATDYMNSVNADGGFTSESTNAFKACLRNIPVPPSVGSRSGARDTPGGAQGNHEHFYDQFFVPGTLQDLIEHAGVRSETTTQDSVDTFCSFYSDANYIVGNAGDGISFNLSQQLSYAFNAGLFFKVYTVVHGVAYPIAPFRYLLSHNAGTLKIPPHWLDYGFDFAVLVDVTLDAPPPLIP